MTDTYFVFSRKQGTSLENTVFIGEDGDFSTIEKYLESKGFDNYLFCKNHTDIEYFKPGSYFIFYDNEPPLKKRLEYPLIPGESVVITNYKGNISEKIITEINEEDYQIFSGDKIGKLKKETKMEILSSMVKISKTMYQMIEAGYLELENNDRIDDWIVTFQEPILDIFIRYHGITTSAFDISTSDEFIINPVFRRNICVSMMKVVANFIINNSLLSQKELKDYDSWEDKQLWLGIKEKVKIFK